jgi:hypothetical protein
MSASSISVESASLSELAASGRLSVMVAHFVEYRRVLWGHRGYLGWPAPVVRRLRPRADNGFIMQPL